MLTKLGVVADDLTGACDVAGAFATAGLRTAVRLGVACDARDVEVLIHDADVRDTLEPEIGSSVPSRFRASTEAIESSGARVRMLKIDSTLRGPVAFMVASLLRRTGVAGAIVAPAFPRQGRFLVHGRLVLGGSMALQGVSAAELLKAADVRVEVIAAEVARTSVEELEKAVFGALARGAQAVVIDTDAEECLENAAKAWARHRERWLLVGSAGVARHASTILARQHAERIEGRRGPVASPRPANELGVLIVSGSPTVETAAQLEVLALSEDVQVFEITPDASDEPRLLMGGRNVTCLRTPPPDSLIQSRPPLVRDDGERAGALARAVGELARRACPAGLVLIGGATARGVLEELGTCGVDMHGEVEAGIPYGTMRGGRWDGVPTVTKAGGFGDAESVLRAVRWLRQEEQ